VSAEQRAHGGAPAVAAAAALQLASTGTTVTASSFAHKQRCPEAHQPSPPSPPCSFFWHARPLKSFMHAGYTIGSDRTPKSTPTHLTHAGAPWPRPCMRRESVDVCQRQVLPRAEEHADALDPCGRAVAEALRTALFVA
jgi:hypothetical protein